MLPEGVHVFSPDDRDWDGYYGIAGGNTHCFAFTVPEGTKVDITMIHNDLTAQDHSLRCWFSDGANGAVWFSGDDTMDVFPMPRVFRSIPIWDLALDKPTHALDATRTWYLMVKNLQNKENRYQLEFNIQA
jgi:hypothetical protein